MAALINFLKAQNFLTYTKGQVQERIKELNDGQASHQVKNYNNSKAEKKDGESLVCSRVQRTH